MKIHLLILLLILGLSTTAQARIGETKDQLITRYGKPVGTASGSIVNKAAPDTVQFIKGGFFIIVWLLNGVSGEEYIAKEDYIRSGKHNPLTQKDIATLLEANAQSHSWKEVKTGRKWQRDDGSIAATNGMVFDVKSKELIDANAATAKTANSSLNGF